MPDHRVRIHAGLWTERRQRHGNGRRTARVPVDRLYAGGLDHHQSAGSGQGDGSVAFRVAETRPGPSSGNVVVSDGSVDLSQAAAPCSFSWAPEYRRVGAEGGTLASMSDERRLFMDGEHRCPVGDAEP